MSHTSTHHANGDDSETVSEKIDKSIHSEDAPLGEQSPSAPFMLVALSYLGVGLLVMLVIIAAIFLA